MVWSTQGILPSVILNVDTDQILPPLTTGWETGQRLAESTTKQAG